jgi:hypothetical protein
MENSLVVNDSTSTWNNFDFLREMWGVAVAQ